MKHFTIEYAHIVVQVDHFKDRDFGGRISKSIC